MHPVVRYWVAGASVLLLAAVVAIHTTHLALAAAIAGFGLGLIAGVNLYAPSAAATAAHEVEASVFAVELAGMVRSLELPAVAFDADQKVMAFNGPASDLFAGIETGVPLSRISRHPELIGILTSVAGDGLPRSIEIVDHAQKGRRLRAGAAKMTSTGAAGEAVLVQFRDLSEQDLLAQMRSDFIANASHELRTPLTSLKGFIETLQGPASNDAAARERFLGIMSTQSARMTRILDDLLSLSRIEMRAHLPPAGSVQLNAVLREVAQSLEPLSNEAGITLALDVPSEGMAVRGDHDELVQVFQNLIHNAIKYGTSGGKVEITLARDVAAKGSRPRARVTVADDGPGIAAEHLPRLTERFYRVDTASSREKGGTGLGLAIVKHILNRHRGDLRIASEVGKGSTFTVLLELAG